MILNPKKLGLAAAIASALYQAVMIIIASVITVIQNKAMMLAGLAGMSLISIPLTCALHFCYAYVLAMAYNRLK